MWLRGRLSPRLRRFPRSQARDNQHQRQVIDRILRSLDGKTVRAKIKGSSPPHGGEMLSTT
jgi:hypothetical protein